MTTTHLSPAQHAILAHAHQHTSGRITWFPDHIKGGARSRVLGGLRARGLITQAGDDLIVSAEGYAALGVNAPQPLAPAPAQPTEPAARSSPSKQAQVIAMLRRPEGATIAQLCEATGWQQHTVRGTFAGAFKKKLGLLITSSKEVGTERIYRVTSNLA